MKPSRNPLVGELVHTDHPSIPILEIDPPGGYLPTGRGFSAGDLALVCEVWANMGKLIFSNGTTGWCNLCFLEVVQ